MSVLAKIKMVLSGYQRLSWRERWLWVQAYIWLGAMRLAINLLPFPFLVRFFGKRQAETPFEVSEEKIFVARRIKRSVISASRFTWWRSNCFPQAAAAQQLLRQHGIGSTLYLGAAFEPTSAEYARGLKAHAWLRCGNYMVTGGVGHRQFGPVAFFASLVE